MPASSALADRIVELLGDKVSRSAATIGRALGVSAGDVLPVLDGNARFKTTGRRIQHEDPRHRDDEDGCPDQDLWGLA